MLIRHAAKTESIEEVEVEGGRENNLQY